MKPVFNVISVMEIFRICLEEQLLIKYYVIILILIDFTDFDAEKMIRILNLKFMTV